MVKESGAEDKSTRQDNVTRHNVCRIVLARKGGAGGASQYLMRSNRGLGAITHKRSRVFTYFALVLATLIFLGALLSIGLGSRRNLRVEKAPEKAFTVK